MYNMKDGDVMNLRKLTVAFIGTVFLAYFFKFCIAREYGAGHEYYVDIWSLYLNIAMVFLAVMISTYVMHILGYLIAGLLSGYKLISVEFYRFVIRKTDGKFHLVYKKGKKGVYVRMSPPDYNDGQFPFVLYRLGAVIGFSVIAFISGIVVIYFLLIDLNFAAFYAACVFWLFACNLILYLMPVSKGLPSVFTEIRQLKKDEYVRKSMWILKKAYTDLHQGISLAEQPEERFYDIDEKYLSDRIVSEILWLKMYRYLETGDFANADKTADMLLSEKCGQGADVKKFVTLEKIFILLVTGAPQEAVDGLLTADIEKFIAKRRDNINVKRVNYALSLLYCNDSEMASVTKAELEKDISNLDSSADILTEKELMNAIECRYIKMCGKIKD